MPASIAAQALAYSIIFPSASSAQTATSRPNASQLKKSGKTSMSLSSSSSSSFSSSSSSSSVSSSSSSSPVTISGLQTKKSAVAAEPSFSIVSIKVLPVHWSITVTSKSAASSAGMSKVCS